jgi:hypothetical protein
MKERFEILDPGYQAGLHGIPPSFQARVRRTTSPRRSEHQQNITYNVSGPNSRVNVGSTDQSTNVSIASQTIWAEARRTIERGVQEPERSALIAAIERLSQATDKPSFARSYGEFVALAANHMTLLGPLLPQVLSLMP